VIRDATVAKVETEKLRIVLRGDAHRLRGLPAPGTGLRDDLPDVAFQWRSPPVEDRAPGDSQATGDLAVV
jgi:hypothetical protein